MEYLHAIAGKARLAARSLALADTAAKDAGLKAMAAGIIAGGSAILEANAGDVARARESGMRVAMIDRLLLNGERLEQAAEGLRALVALPDPVGEVISMGRRPNGLTVGKRRVPLGVLAMIYESRPNVTVDAAGLAVKSGNAVILRGGSEAIASHLAIAKALRDGLSSAGLPEDAVQVLERTDRETATALMRLKGGVDLLIPRGGAGLINSVMENATVPVLETGLGNCHTYVDEGCDLAMARRIAVNAKVNRPSVCNAMETLLVHAAEAKAFLPVCLEELRALNVEIRGCERVRDIVPWALAADESDWETEYNDLILAVRVVDSMDEAIAHIAKYSTRNSEAIVTSSYARANEFVDRVDAAAVYVNASTRFTDGYEFGLGAEIGISTQKLHARGPVGLRELTTTKFVVYGNGQIRE